MVANRAARFVGDTSRLAQSLIRKFVQGGLVIDGTAASLILPHAVNEVGLEVMRSHHAMDVVVSVAVLEDHGHAMGGRRLRVINEVPDRFCQLRFLTIAIAVEMACFVNLRVTLERTK